MRWFGWFRRKPQAPTGLMQEAVATLNVGGRKRAAGVPYPLPADLEETNRLDFQHYLLRFAFQGLYAAPISRPASMLDVGTGTGRWALEMAGLFPQARVIGLDIQPPPADQAANPGAADTRPPNYRFQAGNVLEGLPFPDDTFDFVHMRLLVAAIPADRWQFVVNELARVTRPGGWIESIETVPPHDGGPALDRVFSWIVDTLARRGISYYDGGKVAERMRDAGLVQVVARDLELPMGAHGGRIGNMVAVTGFAVARGLSGMMVANGVTTAEEFDRAVAAAQAEVNAPQSRAVTTFPLAYGQKPT
jgi:ubiquinone/menaquinone biosynthesis C-methylase UbiE